MGGIFVLKEFHPSELRQKRMASLFETRSIKNLNPK
jgi:hypothetical protein